ncbi:endonuclease domain-containing protein [Bradyrhizobium sp. Arg237L]|uniref:endonuclease domain-containing protein n=1 Tax=Bradyrhizobium sp. Arg237L TaxID=3003352 RepID=UPI00249E3A2B|nr:endonuclease domain-containing protein [Bradyrhizobium sp. Arg237L]MDI4232480.1 endonuclease domain-containing protein [Bradyrhizobium sp. Arg237L]
MTDAELRLWRALRRDQLNGLSFRKQHPIGPYTVDFYCSRLRLAVEVDGGQHAEERKKAADRRTRWLAEKGVTVVRYWNNDVLSNLEGVLSDLLAHTERLAQAETTPTPTLPLSGGGRSERSPSHLPLKRGGRFARQRKPGGDQLSPHAPVPGADPHPTLPLSGGGRTDSAPDDERSGS